MDEIPDGHCHDIIRPFFNRAYRNDDVGLPFVNNFGESGIYTVIHQSFILLAHDLFSANSHEVCAGQVAGFKFKSAMFFYDVIS